MEDTKQNTENPKPTRKRSKSWKSMLAEDRRFLENILQDPDSSAKAVLAGFNRTELEKGLALADAVLEANRVHITRNAEKAQQYELFRQGIENLQKTYMQHLEVARRLIGGEKKVELSRKLLLKGSRPRPIDSILDYVNQFYSFALEDKDIGQLLKAYNITPEIIEQMLRLTEEVSTLREQAQRKVIIASRSTKARYEAQEAFYDWFRRFRAIYKITPEPQTVVKKVAVKK